MLASKLTVPVPKIENRIVIKPMLCGSGPCDLWPSVAEALTKNIMSPLCDEYYNVLDDIRNGLKYLFQTKCKLVLALSGSGHSGMEATITNLVGPNETLLIATRGIWDERALNAAQRYNINVIPFHAPLNGTFSLERIEAELKRWKPAALFITHGDSSTGTVQKLEGLGELCHKYDALLIVDAVVSIGGVPFLMDEWQVDAVYASTQKALSGPAGISPVAFSDRAAEKIYSRRHQPPFNLDIKMLAQQWNCFGSTRAYYHHTLSPPLLWALRQCLLEINKRTLPVIWQTHADVLAYFHMRLEEYGFKLLIPKAEDHLATVTTVKLPEGYDYPKFVTHMRVNYNILINAGLGPTLDRALRIGVMGVNATTEIADAVAEAMAATLKAFQ